MNTKKTLDIELFPVEHRIPYVTEFECHYDLLHFSTFFVHHDLNTDLLPEILKYTQTDESIKVHVTELENMAEIPKQLTEIIEFIESHEIFVIFSSDLKLLSTAMYYLGYKPQIQ